ncbi:YlbL family protein [Janibacter alittae]|uniref:endopeptidase La n=1 Tax=Janibacter alittae TaxID=3115209 RepID=A0ABZ2MJH0_9MICO
MPEVSSHPPRSERIARYILVIAVLFLIVSLLGSFIKVPYAVESPGPVTDTLGELDDGTQLVRVEGAKTYPTDGHLYFTTVRILGGPDRHISVWEWVSGHVDPNSRVVPEDSVFGEDRSAEEVEQLNSALMEGSQHTSIAVALRSLDEKVGQEDVVARIAKGKPADGALQVEDVVLTVDGERPDGLEELVDTIGDREVGDEVTLVVRRDGSRKSVTLETADIGGGNAGIGVVLEPRYDYPFEVRIDAGHVGGPSAGMMFALAVRDRLTPGAMTKGESVAGTGTISDSGKVGPIGGIAQKMVGAHEGGADWFLAPEKNCSDVVGHVPDDLEVVAVETYDDAVTAVESIASGDGADLPSCEDAA